MTASSAIVTLLILGFITSGLTENFSSISSKIIDSTSSKILGNMKDQCDQYSSPIAIKIFQKAENMLKSKVELNMQKSYSKIIRSTFILKTNFNGLCDIDDAVHTYIVAAKPCLMEKKVQYQAEDFSNSPLERRIFPTPEIDGIINTICISMKNALQNAIDLKCFQQNIPQLRECFKNNEYFKDHVSILTDSKIFVQPRNFPYHVIKTAQPSFLTDIREIIDFRRCIIDVLKSCKFTSLGHYLEVMFLPSLERIQSLLM